MNLIKTNLKTMSSREIAELTDKRHDNVVQLIRKLEIDHILTPEFQEIEFKGRSLPVYQLSKRDSMVLVARLSPEFTAAVVDRWQELEAQQAPAVPTDFISAIMSSREIAELTGKRHDNVQRTIRSLIEQDLGTQIEQSNFDSRGKEYTEFLLTQRDLLVLVGNPPFNSTLLKVELF